MCTSQLCFLPYLCGDEWRRVERCLINRKQNCIIEQNEEKSYPIVSAGHAGRYDRYCCRQFAAETGQENNKVQ